MSVDRLPVNADSGLLGYLARQRDAAADECRNLVMPASFGRLQEVDALESRLDDLARANERLERVASVAVRREPFTYDEHGDSSFFADLHHARIGDTAAEWRLEQHGREMRVELERREVLRQQAWTRGAERYGLKRERRDLTRVDGSGGYFVPPLWLVDEAGVVPRAGRVLADRVASIPLPAGTDQVSVPRILTGAGVAIQTADNAAVQETDLIDGAVTSPVRTIAGHSDVATQLAEQSAGPSFDRVVFADLLADYDAKLEAQLIAGTGASGQVTGLLAAAGTNTTYTSATPTVAATYSRIGDLASQVATARQRVPSLVLMHPRRAFWLMTQADAQSRPMNPVDLAAPERDPNADPVGSLAGMSLVLDPAVPTNQGGGTEDRVIVTHATDVLLLESEPRLMVHGSVGSGTLTTRFSAYNYIVFIANRVPSATGVLGGTGLAAPVFA